MKKAVVVLVILAAIVTAIAMVSRVTMVPISGIKSRAMVDFAAVLLLFAIALK